MNAIVTPLRSLDTLADELVAHWSVVSREMCAFLVCLREFDLRQGYKEWGCADCADWLNYKCGIVRGTAKEKLRVAYALLQLPQIEEAFRRGALSYSKVRALTRVATPTNETDLLDFALHATAAHVENQCRQLRNGDRDASIRMPTARTRTAH